jgi:hypothetical protein
MLYRIAADIVVLIHFGWIVFMLVGFFVTAWAFGGVYVFKRTGGWEERFLDRWVLRTVHIAGIAYAGTLAVIGRYCPVTMLENFFRRRYDPASTYPGGFLIHYIERIVYPDVPVQAILIPTVIIAVLTLVMFAVRPPLKIKEIIRRILSR